MPSDRQHQLHKWSEVGVCGHSAHSFSVEVLFNVSACLGKCGKLKTALVTKDISVLTKKYNAESPVSFRTAETSLPAATAYCLDVLLYCRDIKRCQKCVQHEG